MSKVSSLKPCENKIQIIEEETYNGQTTKRVGVFSSPKKRNYLKMTPVESKDFSMPFCISIHNEFNITLSKPIKKAFTNVFPCNIQLYTGKEIDEEENQSPSDVSSFELDSNDDDPRSCRK